jgi:hypothetical protein
MTLPSAVHLLLAAERQQETALVTAILAKIRPGPETFEAMHPDFAAVDWNPRPAVPADIAEKLRIVRDAVREEAQRNGTLVRLPRALIAAGAGAVIELLGNGRTGRLSGAR